MISGRPTRKTTLNSPPSSPSLGDLKVVVGSMPTYTPFKDFKGGFAAHGFQCLRAEMMKNRKTGNPMTLYLCDKAPKMTLIKSIL